MFYVYIYATIVPITKSMYGTLVTAAFKGSH